MQLRSLLWSMLFGSLLLVGCAEPPATAPATDDGAASDADDTGEMVVEEDVEVTE